MTGRTGYTPLSGRRTAKLVLVVAIAVPLAAAAFLAGRFTAPAADVAAGNGLPAVAHGPYRLVGGVPSGYSRDAAGAVSAAAGWQFTMLAASNMQVDLARIAPELGAANPSAAVGEAIAALNPARADTQIQLITPITYALGEFTPDQATVRVWSCAVQINRTDTTAPRAAAADTSTPLSCGVTSLALSWEQQDWKVADRSWRTAAGPGEAIAQGIQQQVPGMLTVFVE